MCYIRLREKGEVLILSAGLHQKINQLVKYLGRKLIFFFKFLIPFWGFLLCFLWPKTAFSSLMIDITAKDRTMEEFRTGSRYQRRSGITCPQPVGNAHYRLAIIQGADHPEDAYHKLLSPVQSQNTRKGGFHHENWVETELLTLHPSHHSHEGPPPYLDPFERGTHRRPSGQMSPDRAASWTPVNKPQSEQRNPPQTTTVKTKKTKQKYPASPTAKAPPAREALKLRFRIGARVSSPAKQEKAASIPKGARETMVSRERKETSYKGKEGGLSSARNNAEQDVNYATNVELQDCYRIVLGSFKRPLNAEQLLQKLDSPEAMVVYVPKYHTYRVVYASYEKVETADAHAVELLEHYPQAWIVKF